MNSSIRYLVHDDIDPDQWDECVRNAPNGLIYAYSFYLDQMAVHWDGLVLGDYKAVMPLIWNRKFGIFYLYQPPFIASAGVFGNDLTEQLVGDFIEAIPAKFKLIEINLNAGNIFSFPSGFTQLRSNYVLPLAASYEQLQNNYRENIKRNIRKCLSAGCVVKTGIPVLDVINIAMEQLESLVNIHEHYLFRFRKLYEFLQTKQQATTYGIYSPSGQLLSSAVYFFSHNRAYYILVGNHPNGRTLGASHYLIDRFIADHAGNELLLDFEGSDIRNLAFFYSSFGATQEVYPALRIERLPWYVKLFKK